MDRKRILFFHHSSTLGGAGISGLNLVKAIPKEKYEITIYCNSQGGPMPAVYQKAGFEVIHAGKSPVVFNHFVGGENFVLSPHAIINYFEVILDIKNVKAIIDKINPDIIIVNSMTLFWIGKIAKKKGKETICFCRETYAKGLLGVRTKIIRYYLGEYFDKISFISKYDLERSKNLPNKKVTIFNAVHSDYIKELDGSKQRQELGLTNDNYYVLFVGGMSPLKGAVVAIKSLLSIPNKKVKLIFVGYQWNSRKKRLSDCRSFMQKIKFLLHLDYEKKCLDIIVNKDLSNRIVFVPAQLNIAPYYAASDALVFPATRPHQGRPIFEAGLARIPVITTDFPNIREFINRGTGFLFENRNIKQLAIIISHLADNPNIAHSLVEANYMAAIRRHSPQIYNEEILTLLTDNS